MSTVTDRDNSSEVGSKALDHYIHAVTICNSLALLVSQGSLKDFAARIALLTALRKCWLNGHSVLQLVCSCDGAIDFISNLDVHHSATSSAVHFTKDENVWDTQSSKLCNDNGATEAWSDSTVECLNASDIVTEKSVVAAYETEKWHEKLRHQPNDTTASEPSDSVDESSVIVGRSLYSVCDVCCRRFASAKSLAKHLKSAHKIEPIEIPGNNNQQFNYVAPGADTDGSSGSRDKPQKAQFICTVCGQQFRLRQLLAAHSVTHTGARPAACRFPGCTKRFGQTSTRNYHERTHSDVRPYVCSQCGRSYKQPTILKTHVAVVHGNGARPHQCLQCGKAFKLNGALQTHCRTVHMDKRPHSCAECSKLFKYRSELSRHVRALHRREQPWQCSVCDRKFTQLGNLRTHMRMHTGEKPYPCSVCGQSFAHSGTLKGHMATHGRPNKHTNVNSQANSSRLPPFVVDQPFQQL